MTSRKKSKKLLAKEILDAVLTSPTSNADYVVEREGAKVLLQYGYRNIYGDIFISYLPTGLAESFLEDCGANLDRVLENIVVRSVNGEPRNEKLSDKPLSDSERQILVKSLTLVAVRFFIEGLSQKLAWALGESIDEALELASAAIQASIVEDLTQIEKADVKVEITKVKERFENLVRSMVDERQRFLEGSFELFFPKPNFDNLASRYEPLLTIWQEAKKIYQSNRKHSMRQDMIRKLYPTLPDDLIERLGRKGDSAPSNIAIEHAARLCGAQRNQLSARHYFRLMANRGVEKE